MIQTVKTTSLDKLKRSNFIDLRKANGVTKTWLSEQHLIFAGITTEVPDIPKTVDISLGKSFDILVQIQKVSPSQFFAV